MAIKWEYKRIKQDSTEVVKQLHELGAKGWELVTIDSNLYYYFKRPMSCENCKYYKREIIYSRYGSTFSNYYCTNKGKKELLSFDGCIDIISEN